MLLKIEKAIFKGRWPQYQNSAFLQKLAKCRKMEAFVTFLLYASWNL
jgi:hypothetical protein